MRQTDWAALADVQFQLYTRLSNQLNEALTSLALSDMPEAQDKPPGYWKDRATTRILNVLNLFTAWTWLVRFKMGEPIPERAVRPFRTNDLLKWLGGQLQLYPQPVTTSNPLLRANQETLQEALLLLHSVAYSQGSSVRLAFEATQLGTWFRVRFNITKPVPATLDDLLASFSDHWRDQDISFELATARDFVRLNGCELALNQTATYGEFAFFVRTAAARRRTDLLPAVDVQEAQSQAQSDDNATPVLASDAAGDGSTPVPGVEKLQTRADDSATPVVADERQDTTEDTPPPAPPLAVLRPLPPQMMPSEPKITAPRPVEPHETKPEAPELPPATLTATRRKDAPITNWRRKLVAPAASGSPVGPSATLASGENAEAQDRRKSDSVIIKLKLPEPTLPDRLRTPPAATSALDTQTQPAVKSDDPPAGQREENA